MNLIIVITLHSVNDFNNSLTFCGQGKLAVPVPAC